jgi:hypothetical protein
MLSANDGKRLITSPKPATLLRIAEMPNLEHVCYSTGDADAPSVIKDANGEVALGLCKICGRAEAELSEPCIPSDKKIVDWLQSMHNLHTQVEALYVVDGYQVSLTWDEHPVFEFKGETLREAYAKAMRYKYENRHFVRVR